MEVLDNQSVKQILIDNFKDEILSTYEPDGILTLEIKPEALTPIVTFIKDNESLKIDFLTDICGIHYPDNQGKELGTIYHLHSFTNNFRIRLKAFMPLDKAEIASLTPIYSAANWMERETFDFYGILFSGHPNLTRILNIETMDYHPMLKQYRLEDTTRTDKNDAMFGR